MTIHIPKQYLVYGGIAIAAGLAYWYLKSSGYWDQWFNAQGQVIPVGPSASAAVPPLSQGLVVPDGAPVGAGSGVVN